MSYDYKYPEDLPWDAFGALVWKVNFWSANLSKSWQVLTMRKSKNCSCWAVHLIDGGLLRSLFEGKGGEGGCVGMKNDARKFEIFVLHNYYWLVWYMFFEAVSC